ncbi:MAG: hypothetical protein FJ301_08140 [Planctomycetes bacterium]|nr:hypothetical protein [Planctomycetota bacterium]
MQIHRQAVRRPLRLGVVLLVAACAAPPRGPYEPLPLRGDARQLVLDALASAQSPPRPDTVTVSDGSRVPYDRHVLVGSEFADDRASRYYAFVDELRRRGGDFASLEHGSGGRPAKILVDVDGQRVVVTYLRW